MTFFNQMDIEDAVARGTGIGPNYYRAARILARVAGDADNNSDGWHSWPLPCRASQKLIALLEKRTEPTEAALKQAVAPIKAFYTRTRKKVPSYPLLGAPA